MIYSLTTSANPPEGGTVNGGMDYNDGEIASISATPSAEYEFKNWSGSASGTSPSTTVTMNSNKSVTANFVKKKYTVTLKIEGEGNITEKVIKTGAATDYNSGTILELTAIPEDEWLFVEWKGDLTGSENPKQITIDKAKTVTAVFVKKQYSLTIEKEGEGYVSEKVIKSGLANDYNSGTVIELTARGQTGWNFKEWQGDLTGSENPKQITIDKAKNVKAIFEEEEKYVIKFDATFEEGVFKDLPNNSYSQATTITNDYPDSIAKVIFEVKNKWGQGSKWNKLITRDNHLSGRFNWEKEAYKNSEVKITVEYPHHQYMEVVDWGDDYDSSEQSIELLLTNDITLDANFKSIKVNIFSRDLREKLANTSRRFPVFNSYSDGYGANKYPILKYTSASTPKVPLVNFWNIVKMNFSEIGPFTEIDEPFMPYLKDLRALYFTKNIFNALAYDGLTNSNIPASGQATVNYWELAETKDYNQHYNNFDGSIFKKLEYLQIGSISSIDVSQNDIIDLGILSSPELNQIDLSNNTKIEDLAIVNTGISELNLNDGIPLIDLKIINSPLSAINLPTNNYHKSNFKELVLHNLDLGSFKFENYSASIDVFNLKDLVSLKNNSLIISNNSNMNQLYLDNVAIEELDLSNNNKIKTISVRNMPSLKSISFTETDITTFVRLSETNLNSIDLTPLSNLGRIDIENDTTIKIIDISQNKEIWYVDLKSSTNIECLIVSQYHIDNKENITWKLPDGLEIKLNCN